MAWRSASLPGPKPLPPFDPARTGRALVDGERSPGPPSSRCLFFASVSESTAGEGSRLSLPCQYWYYR
ncbi:hypothetical protein STEG23_029843, partial [Scotinomys teguina]